MNGLRTSAMVAALFVVVLLGLSPVLPFWLDEVLQLAGTTPDNSVAQVIAYVPQNPGGVPLGYLVQHAFLEVGGINRWGARLPSVLFAGGAIFMVALLARQLGAEMPEFSGLVLGILPIVLRYATEGRPYSQGLFLSVSTLVCGIWLADRPSWGRGAVYFLTVAAGLYTQPFTVFTAVAQVGWLWWRGSWSAAKWAFVALLLAALAFVPWLLYARGGWQQTIATSQFQFSASPRIPLMLLKELTGAGYFGGGILVICAIVALRRPGLAFESKLLLSAAVVVPVVGGLIADAFFGYFLAIRQFIWVLPPLAILAAEGMVRVPGPWRAVPRLALLIAALVAAVGHFSNPRENWEAAAEELARLTPAGACLEVITPDQALYYEFFRPELKKRRCENSRIRVVAVSPYGASRPQNPTGEKLVREASTGGTTILVYERRAPAL